MRADGQTRDLSPSALQSLRELRGGGRTSWRQGLDGSGALLAAFLTGTVAAFALRMLRRR